MEGEGVRRLEFIPPDSGLGNLLVKDRLGGSNLCSRVFSINSLLEKAREDERAIKMVDRIRAISDYDFIEGCDLMRMVRKKLMIVIQLIKAFSYRYFSCWQGWEIGKEFSLPELFG